MTDSKEYVFDINTIKYTGLRIGKIYFITTDESDIGKPGYNSVKGKMKLVKVYEKYLLFERVIGTELIRECFLNNQVVVTLKLVD